ncbi:DUF1565 domain-containing protein [Synechococcus sp. PCC 7336]|uniref:DUF1565 domain-containing protein n=1 Tax=Synechococcus sp. PCC 7336 TaxID=195250 RepID=UPI0003478EF1|nr:DUF1565 domain-containing protein [Synechococcus sp. PCC 7336]
MQRDWNGSNGSGGGIRCGWRAAIALGIGLLASFPIVAVLPVLAQSGDRGAISRATSARTVFVDVTRGSDSQGNGSQTAPLRTITAALRFALPGTTVQLAPGTYSAATGEVFPISIPTGVTLRGNESNYGEAHIIQGGGVFISPTLARQSIALLPQDGAEIRGVTVFNQGRRGYAIWLESTSPRIERNSLTGSIHDGVFMVGSSAPTIEDNRFYRNGANGITILGTSTPTIVNNLIQETGYGITAGGRSAPHITHNRISRNRSGLVLTGNTTPVLRSNVISENLEAGLVAIASAQPNLGTPTDPGNNRFEGNGELHIHNATRTQLVFAAHGNQIAELDKIEGQVSTGHSRNAADSGVAVPNLVAAEPLEAAPAATTATEAAPTATATPSDSTDEFRAVPFAPERTSQTARPDTPPLATDIPAPVPATQDVIAVASSPSNRYRIIVTPRNNDTLSQLQSLVSTATAAQLAGRNIFVAGQYTTRAETQQVLDRLTAAGYFATAQIVSDSDAES